MKVEFEFKEGSTKFTDDMNNVTEEMFEKVGDRRARLFADITKDVLFNPSYNMSHAMKAVQEAFPPGELESQVFYLFEVKRALEEKIEFLHEKIKNAVID